MKQERVDTERLLASARELWLSGDWNSLAQIKLDPALRSSRQAELAVLVAAAQLQLGEVKAARPCLEIALREDGGHELVQCVLTAGVYNVLGRAAAIEGDVGRALQYFRRAVDVPTLFADSERMTIARAQAEYKALSIPVTDEQFYAASKGKNDSNDRPSFDEVLFKQVSAFNLGQGWAGNTINTVIFRHHGIVSSEGYQYTAFYVDGTTLRVVQRELATDQLNTCDIKGEYNLRDAHNSISLGLDRDGRIHMAYDLHASRLRYRRSTGSHSIDVWTDELPMTGMHEGRVTYPTFILPRGGHPLTLLYRDGVHNNGCARIKIYDERTANWTDVPTPILSGAEQRPWTSNAYWNHPAIGSDGSIHLSFVWRTDMPGEEQVVNNVNIGYAWSPDNGESWFTSLGKPYRLPITQVNAEVIWPISPGSNLINQTSMGLDSQNRPHIVFYANDSDGIPQYQHIWFDGLGWHHEYFSDRSDCFYLKGKGTLRLPISRPEILIDKRDNVFAVFRGDLTGDRMSVARLTSKVRLRCREDVARSVPRPVWLWPEALGSAEPMVDRMRWTREQVLTILLQQNVQPDGDGECVKHVATVALVDYRIV